MLLDAFHPGKSILGIGWYCKTYVPVGGCVFHQVLKITVFAATPITMSLSIQSVFVNPLMHCGAKQKFNRPMFGNSVPLGYEQVRFHLFGNFGSGATPVTVNVSRSSQITAAGDSVSIISIPCSSVRHKREPLSTNENDCFAGTTVSVTTDPSALKH
jgi:hypothetical protein